MKALIDLGAQISDISKNMAKTLGLPIQKLETLLDIEGSAGSQVPYLGYTELRLDIPEIAKFDHDVLMMVYPNSIYSHRIPAVIETLHIDEALDLATYDELVSLSRGWKRGIVGCRVIAKQLSLKGPDSEPTIHKIGGTIKLTKVITMAPRQVIKIMGLTQVPVLSKRVNVATEAINNLQDGRVELLSSYESIKPGSQRVAVALYNNTSEKIILKKGTIVVKVAAANVVPPMLAPASDTFQDVPEMGDGLDWNGCKDGYVPSNGGAIPVRPPKPEPTQERLDELFSKLDLKGIENWSEYDQNQVCELMKEYQHLFALDDLELGSTSQIKHEIKLSDPKPFKDCYRQIPPQQFKEVRAHLQDMLKVGAICKSTSPWASPVVLRRKKDGSLRFCIDL